MIHYVYIHSASKECEHDNRNVPIWLYQPRTHVSYMSVSARAKLGGCVLPSREHSRH